ncbi:hypothetical protein ACLI1A_10370 [Flavobacterium sp. RHBU_3]|uniref:hypothetical protein n=1 Tax=Flavobacterium sp. RHBU_3 TaxID=3391184 RepID=UPI003984908F
MSFTIVGFFATIYQAKLRIAAENSLDLSYRQKLTGIYLAMFIVFGILSVATA